MSIRAKAVCCLRPCQEDTFLSIARKKDLVNMLEPYHKFTLST